MKKIFLATILVFVCLIIQANTSPVGKIGISPKLRTLSANSLNYSDRTPEDSIINLCRMEIISASRHKDYARQFKARQIEVNSYCLKGDLGLAANKAYEMYEDARSIGNELATGFALQAIGDTYMHTGHYKMADENFGDAFKKIAIHGDDESKLQLLIQRIHVCSQMSDTDHMRKYISDAAAIINSPSISNVDIYKLYLLFYEGLQAIQARDNERAEQLIRQIPNLKSDNLLLNRGRFILLSRYYMAIGDSKNALIYSDSVLNILANIQNRTEYLNAMTDKAILLEKADSIMGACDMYKSIAKLTDSLDMEQYIRQIDSLHTIYYTDELQIANAAAKNSLMTKVIVYIVIVLITTIAVVVMVRRRIAQLTASRKRLEAARENALESIKSKSVFLSNMSHELRTPLNAIVGFSSMLTEDGSEIDGKTREEYGGYIRQNADLLLKLINDIVDLSALNGSNIKFSNSICDAVSLCRNVVETIERVKQTRASVAFITEESSIKLNTDSERLQQVLINLLINATKFTKEGSIILRLAVDHEKNEAVFSIEDTGCGIPLEKQARIFERFEKLHEGAQGVGLGLSICKLIVDHVGGRIWIDSAYTAGTRFVFTHPINTPQQP